MLTIYNSLTQTKEPFKPINPGHVKMYVCGMTVYDYCHLGHARTMVAFDVIVRYLRAQGYSVDYVSNITDIDDKIIARAHENNENYEALTSRFIAALHEDMRALNVIMPDSQPRATHFMPDMIALIQALLKEGAAYVADNGDVYYNVKSFANYGQLAHRDLDKLQAGARVEVSHAKHSPLDFVLWKLAKPHEPSWDSPWGLGRPGWHLECSAMSMKCLGEHFDIHGGGFDLIFPHHENEIAQSEGATHHRFVNTWMHVGFLQINKEKMSKSLKNFFTIREILSRFNPEVVRYFILTSHYRSPLNFSEEALLSAKAALERMYLCLRDFPAISADKLPQNQFTERFMGAMNDDFNTPDALAVLFELVREINREKGEDPKMATQFAQQLWVLGSYLGLQYQSPETFLKSEKTLDPAKIEQLIEARAQARKDKNYARADQIRQELDHLGVVIEDGPSGTSWRVKTV